MNTSVCVCACYVRSITTDLGGTCAFGQRSRSCALSYYTSVYSCVVNHCGTKGRRVSHAHVLFSLLFATTTTITKASHIETLVPDYELWIVAKFACEWWNGKWKGERKDTTPSSILIIRGGWGQVARERQWERKDKNEASIHDLVLFVCMDLKMMQNCLKQRRIGYAQQRRDTLHANNPVVVVVVVVVV